MNSVLDEKIHIDDVAHEDYKTADDETMMLISDRLLEQHIEAYRALANA